jgi:hypothetical protein
MAFSWQESVKPAGTQDIQCDIEYLDKSYIHVYLDGAETTAFTWTSSTNIRLNSPLSAETAVLLIRKTEREYLYIEFASGAPFIEGNVDTQNTQFLHLAQELVEGRSIEGFYGDINMHRYRITNLGGPVDALDAANKQYVDAGDARLDARVDAEEAARKAADSALDVRTTNLEQTYFNANTNSFPWWTITVFDTNTITPGMPFSKAKVRLNGVTQTAGYSYSVSNGVITFAETVPAGTLVDVTIGVDTSEDTSAVSTVLGLLAGADGASYIGLPHGTLGQGVYWVTPEMFGAVGDGVADDSDALQAAMNACVEYEWQGTVADTDDHGGTSKYTLMLTGQYRFTRTLVLPPFLRMVGIGQSYLADPKNNVVKFIPDFSLQDGYAFESLNFDETGTHTAKVDTYSASASDRRLITRCPGLLLENFSVVAGANTSLKGIFNLRLTHGAVLKSICARITSRAAVGANLTCTWNGAFRDCIFRTATIALTLRNNVTTWLFDNCYFQTTQGDNPLPWFTDFPEFYGYPTRQTWTACVAGTWSSPHFKDCTLENSQNGYRLHRCQGGSEHGTYFENIEEECYALMECVLSMTPGYFYSNKGAAATTRMVFLSGSLANSASIDMTNTNYFSQTVDPYHCSGASKLVVTTAGDMRTSMKITYPNKVIFNCYSQFSGYCDVYVSSTGNDGYNGYSATYPVKTLQEALLRCQPGYKNRIYLAAGDTITTTKYYSDGYQPNRRFFQGYDIRIIGDSTNRPTLVLAEDSAWLSGVGIKDGSISFSQLNINLVLSSSSSAAATAFGALVYATGSAQVILDSCTVSGSSSSTPAFLVSPAQLAGMATILINDCTLANINIVQSSSISGMGLAYILNHSGCSFTSVTEGATFAKIYARAIA